MRKLIPATSMLLVSAMMLASSTYAWFTMNKEVTVTGMEVRTKVGANLLITEDSYKLTDANDNKDAKYKKDIAQLRKCLLEPSSTTDGKNFWYTVEAAANGAKLSGADWLKYNEGSGTAADNLTAGKTHYDGQFNTKYAIGNSGSVSPVEMGSGTTGAAYGYVDYNFYIKATADTNSQKVVLTNCNLKYNDSTLLPTSGAVPNVDRAWRVAVFSDSATRETDLTTEPSNLVTILKPSGAVNQTSGYAVNAATATAPVSQQDQKAVIGSIDNAGNTAYYRVTVRLWLEGEDTSCTSETYANLNKQYALDLDFKLENDDSSAVTSITTDPAWWGKLHTSGA